ncbi:MAG: MBL fold metallo-hydrolase [Patescibacteria group bacterium]|jgi:glyoxylase-like metal-dependent hydrolase (beta-lactamase superfamily II)
MTEVKVLIDGYDHEIEGGWIASSTTTLIKLDNKNIVVDPGCNRARLISSLAENNLKTGDIDFVLQTHNHTDHILLSGIFENAKIVTPTELYDNDRQTYYDGQVLGLDLEIIKTPGHSGDSRSFIVKVEGKTYAVAGDLFWWVDGEGQKIDRESLANHPDPYAKDIELLKKNRQKILDLADFIIPGHGKMFANKKG